MVSKAIVSTFLYVNLIFHLTVALPRRRTPNNDHTIQSTDNQSYNSIDNNKIITDTILENTRDLYKLDSNRIILSNEDILYETDSSNQTPTLEFNRNTRNVNKLDDRRKRIRKIEKINLKKKRNVKYVYNNEFSEAVKSNPVVPTVESRKKTTEEKTLSDVTFNKNSVSGQNVETSTTRKDTITTVDNDVNGRVSGSLKNANSREGHGRICVHKYSNVAHLEEASNSKEKSALSQDYDGTDYTEYDEREPVLSNMTIDGIGTVKVEYCLKPTEFCYAFWSQAEDGIISILGQGCWESSDVKQSCSRDACSAEKSPPRTSHPTKFCCCKADLCNASPMSLPPESGILSTEESSTLIPAVESSFKALSYGMTLSVGGACLGGVFITALILLLCHHFRRSSAKDVHNTRTESGNGQETGGPGFSCSATCVDNLKLHDNIGEGRHAKVWRGSLGGIPVAVKAVPACRSALWTRERDIYCLPHMGHPNLLAYFGCDTRPTLDGSSEHLLVLQLAPLGSLRQYLTQHTLDWDSYTKMALGVASALAHLHTHIDRDEQYKPCVVHRDVNSSNVVVRADLSCCLADLGLAMALPDSRRKQQHHKIQEAGTLRYLSPEALEGALDLRRCGAALRAVDVYALALVLWELLSRCAPAHRAPGPHPYEPPYHAQVGDQPTLEQMQVVVGRRKVRPLFSPRLLNTRGARLAKDTCEDCWDHDAEARLTAVCVVERLSELRNLKPAPSPTINSNDLRPPNSNNDAISNSHSPSSIEDKNSNVLSSAASSIPNGNPSTVFDFQSHQMQPLQPHQGRNPCLERNLASAGPGDRLIDKSLKDMPSNSTSSSTNGYGTNDFIRMEQSLSGSNLRNQPQDFSRIDEQNTNSSSNGYNRNTNRFTNQNSSNLINLDQNHDDVVPNEFRMLARPVTPIGYVQNDVSSDVGSSVNSDGHPVKQTNLRMDHSNARWSTRNIRKLLDSKVFRRKNPNSRPTPLETEVNLVLSNGKPINNDSNIANGKVKTSIILNDTRGKNNQDDFRLNQVKNNDSTADRPSSLPGLDTVVNNDVQVKPDAWRNVTNFNDNSTCTLSPPNQTISLNVSKNSRNEVVSFKELPGCSEMGNGLKNQNQVFAVIVPKVNYNNDSNSREIEVVDWKNKNVKALPNVSIIDKNRFEENRLHKMDTGQSVSNNTKDTNRTNRLIGNGSAKRHSCDEKILVPGNGRLCNLDMSNGSSERNYLLDASKFNQNRNSYSGEFEVGKYETYNNEDSENYDPNMMDYSSNSEDEHMLLLAENGGSKITMRPRFDVKVNDAKNKRKLKQNTSLNTQDVSGSLTKMAGGSFTSLCHKYGPKNKYENFENESSEHLLDVNCYIVNSFNDLGSKVTDVSPVNLNQSINSLDDIRRKSVIIDRNDVSVINLVRNGSVLSLCKKEIDDTSFINLNNTDTKSLNLDNRLMSEGNSCHDNSTIDQSPRIEVNDGSSSDDTLRDDVFVKENKMPRPLSIKQNLSRQHSLELVSELFSSSGDVSRLKDPAGRIKTPGDVPASVRRVRGHKRATSMKMKSKSTAQNRLSLYDDRIMFGNSL